MEAFVIRGGVPLRGDITISGAKNVALKAFVASLLTDERVRIRNLPVITDVLYMRDVLRSLGIAVTLKDHSAEIRNGNITATTVPLEVGARLRTSSMVIGPMLARFGEARIPNPGGCRIGARPIDRHIEALTEMGAVIRYNSRDGYYHAKAKKLHGARIRFPKNTHTGTETIMLSAVLAEGETTIENAAQEVEVDDLIGLLVRMGADIRRTAPRTIVIRGVAKLGGADYAIISDRNEEVTFAIAAAVTGGSVTVTNSQRENLESFLAAFRAAGGVAEEVDRHTTRYLQGKNIAASDIVTHPHPGFMTDWQAPWTVYMTQARGTSTIHETIFESRFSYVSELKKMGAPIEFFDPKVTRPHEFYNFNWNDRIAGFHQGIRIHGPCLLHNAIVTIDDLRAGATLLIAALCAQGESHIFGIEQIERGYENIEGRLTRLGARIRRIRG